MATKRKLVIQTTRPRAVAQCQSLIIEMWLDACLCSGLHPSLYGPARTVGRIFVWPHNADEDRRPDACFISHSNFALRAVKKLGSELFSHWYQVSLFTRNAQNKEKKKMKRGRPRSYLYPVKISQPVTNGDCTSFFFPPSHPLFVVSHHLPYFLIHLRKEG